MWTLEWILADQENRRLREHDVSETATLHDATYSSKVLPEELRTQKGLKYFLVLQSPANVRRCTRVEKTETVQEALRMQTVMEYPDVMVSLSEKPEGWELIPRKIMEIKEPVEKKKANNAGRKRKHQQQNKDKAPVLGEQGGAPPPAEAAVGGEETPQEAVKVGRLEEKATAVVENAEGSEEKASIPTLVKEEKPSGVGIQELDGAPEESIEPAAKRAKIEQIE